MSGSSLQVAGSLGGVWRSVQHALEEISPAPREGRMLVGHVVGMGEQALLKGEREIFPREKMAELEALIVRRLAGEPLPYVLGHAPFWGRDWAVTAGVLIPRPDTETLVQAVLDVVPADRPCRVAEVGVGSGAIVGSVLLERPLVTAVGTDISAVALGVAAGNLAAAGVADRCSLVRTSLLEGVEGVFDVIFSNPPYIAEADYAGLDASVRGFEPAEALVAGGDGLDVYKALVPAAAAKLAPNGWLMVEIGWQQAGAVQSLFEEPLWQAPTLIADMAGRARVVVARRG